MDTRRVREAMRNHRRQVHSAAAVVEQIRAAPDRARLIGIDGFMGHGKSHSARQIAAELELGYVEGDEFVDQEKLLTVAYPMPRYAEVLDLDALRAAVDGAIRAYGGTVLDTVFNLEVCQAIARPRSFGVYVLSRNPVPIPGEAGTPTCALYLHQYHERFDAVTAADVLLHNPWPRLEGLDHE